MLKLCCTAGSHVSQCSCRQVALPNGGASMPAAQLEPGRLTQALNRCADQLTPSLCTGGIGACLLQGQGDRGSTQPSRAAPRQPSLSLWAIWLTHMMRSHVTHAGSLLSAPLSYFPDCRRVQRHAAAWCQLASAATGGAAWHHFSGAVLSAIHSSREIV